MKEIIASMFFEITFFKSLEITFFNLFLISNLILSKSDFRIKFYQNLTTTSYRCHRNDRVINVKTIQIPYI